MGFGPNPWKAVSQTDQGCDMIAMPLPWDWPEYSADERQEYQSAMLALRAHRPPAQVRMWILAAYLARDWDWRTCDGCTWVSECQFEGKFRHPACVGHDYACARARRCQSSRRTGDKLFRKANLAFGMSPIRAQIRYLGVRAEALWERLTCRLPPEGW